MPSAGGGYGSGKVGDQVASTLKRQAAKAVSYINTKRMPRKSGATGGYGKTAIVSSIPKVTP